MTQNEEPHPPRPSHRILDIALMILFASAIAQEVEGKTVKILHTQEYTEKNYVVRCNGLCKNITITATAFCGIATLYAREDRPPKLSGWGDVCSKKECTLCEVQDSGLYGKKLVLCQNIYTVKENSFFLSHTCTRKSGMKKLNLEVSGLNIEEVKDLSMSCVTVGGEVTGKDCIFPFTFNNVYYNSCTWDAANVTEGIPRSWCSTSVDENGMSLKGECSSSCPVSNFFETCITVAGEDVFKRCMFPFVHHGIEYSACVKGEGNTAWCSTQNNAEMETIKSGICGYGCPIPEDLKCMTEEGKQCLFPFTFNNKTYKECTYDYSNKAWCSTNVNLGIHVGGSKGICVPSCPVPPKPRGQLPRPIVQPSTVYSSEKDPLNDILADIFFRDLNCDVNAVPKSSLVHVCGNQGFSIGDGKEKIMETCKFTVSDNSTKKGSYRRLCEDPAWYGLRGLKRRSSIQCSGHRPSQDIRVGKLCDQEFNCVDRSDETGCGVQVDNRPYIQLSIDGYDKIWRPRKLEKKEINKMINWEFSGAARRNCSPVVWSSFMPDYCPCMSVFRCSFSRYGRGVMHPDCTKMIEQIAIGDKCYPIYLLCRDVGLRRGEIPMSDFLHPDHIRFCQNFTFWKEKGVRKHHGPLKTRPRCIGNYPGFESSKYWINYQRPGCRRDAQCPDFSDIFCPASDPKCDRPEFYVCKDLKKCIPKNLVCDGHVQCDDASDEDQEYCRKCPLQNGDGHPPRPREEKRANTFSCEHRYTGLPICAIPCDDRDDLCKGFADEVGCEGYQWWIILLGSSLFAACLTIIFVSVDYCIDLFMFDFDFEDMELTELTTLNQEVYDRTRQKPEYGYFLHDSILRYHINDQEELFKFCQHHFGLEMEQNDNNVKLTHEYYFRVLETNTASAIFYDNVENGLFFRMIKSFTQHRFIRPLHGYATVMLLVNMTVVFSQILVYYQDLLKDVLLTHRIYTFLPDLLPVILFIVTCSSIILGELANMMVILNYQPWSFKMRLFAILPPFILFVPAIIKYKIHKIGTTMKKLVKYRASRSSFQRASGKLQSYRTLAVNLRNNENIMEHLPQLLVLIILILISKSMTATVPLHISSNLVPVGDDMLLVASAMISFFSLVRGQLGNAIIHKKSFVPFLGKIVLLLYFTIGTAVRVAALVLFFTPPCGLFSTLWHRKHGQMVASTEDFLYGAIFDIDSDGSKTMFHYLWNNEYKLDKSDQLYYISPIFIGCTLPIMVIVHVVLIRILKKVVFYRGINLSNDGWTNKILSDLNTFLCPPVHLDWEMIYRLSEGSIPIKECWRRSKIVMIAFNGILLIQNMILLVPMIKLKLAIDARNNFLENAFPPNIEEQFSTQMVNSLLFYSLGGFTILPVISCLLTWLYYRKFHAWSKLEN